MPYKASPITPRALGLLANMIRAANDMACDGVASPGDIDLAMCLGARHPVGPLALMRSLDPTTRDALQIGAEAYAPSPASGGVDGDIGLGVDAGEPWSEAPVGVVGTGFMACGIACAIAVAGQQAVVLGRCVEATQGAHARVTQAMVRAAERDRLGGQSLDEVLGRVSTTTEASELSVCDLVIEAVAENLAVKREVFAGLDRTLSGAELLATNTSSLMVRDIAAAVKRPERLGALHFFSPVAAMKLVEVVTCEQLPDTLVGRAAGWVRSIGKVPVGCADRAGFIVNSLLIPFLNDVVRASAEGAGPPAELDEILVAEAGHPMGPFQLLDFIGLDVSLAAQETLFAADPGNERLRPAAPLVQRVAQGHLGRKTGQGFYDYEPAEVAR